MKLKVKIAERHSKIIKINTPFIKLDSLLKFAGSCRNGSNSKAICAGRQS